MQQQSGEGPVEQPVLSTSLTKVSQEVLLTRLSSPIPVETVVISQLEQAKHKLVGEIHNQVFSTALEVVPKQVSNNIKRTQSLVIPDIRHTFRHTDLIKQFWIKNFANYQQQNIPQQLHFTIQ